MQFWTLVVDSFRESIDRKIFWVMVVLSLIAAATMACIGMENDRVTFLFGLWDIETNHYSPLSGLGRTHIASLVVYMLTYTLLGWIGVILMIIATAGMFPTMMQRGAIDVVLSKPIGRYRLFIYKYLASMVFVLIQASLFVGLTFLVMGFRWGVWLPGYLLSIPLLVLLFSYVYCVSVLVAVKTRSAVAATLLSIVAWVLYICPVTAVQTFEQFPSLQKHERVYRMLRMVSWIPPKTGEVAYLAAKWAGAGTSLDMFPSGMMQSRMQPHQYDQLDRAREMEKRELMKNPFISIGSSLCFEAVVVLLAMWNFARKDY